MRGIRGATTVGRNEKEEIWLAAQELITELLRTNAITPADIGAAIFSVTDDLTAAFPTAGVRRIAGFDLVPLFDARQCAIEDSLPRCIRVLLLVNTDTAQSDIHHVYLRAATNLRPDLEG
jgi:chorismate mutase